MSPTATKCCMENKKYMAGALEQSNQRTGTIGVQTNLSWRRYNFFLNMKGIKNHINYGLLKAYEISALFC